jgi:hypothetical protein
MTKAFHIIYKTTCSLTDRYYYGMHSTNDPSDGYLGSGKFLGNSINKYGIENHVCEHLEFFESREKLKQRELEIVDDKMLKDPLCMNLKKGGEGGGRLWSSEHAKSFHKAGGKKVFQMLAQRHCDRLKNDPVYLAKYKATMKRVNTEHPTFLGHTHTEETKAAMRRTHEINKFQQGERNSAFGKCWITKDGESQMIKKEKLSEYLTLGWVKGRKYLRKSETDFGLKPIDHLRLITSG